MCVLFLLLTCVMIVFIVFGLIYCPSILLMSLGIGLSGFLIYLGHFVKRHQENSLGIVVVVFGIRCFVGSSYGIIVEMLKSLSVL